MGNAVKLFTCNNLSLFSCYTNLPCDGLCSNTIITCYHYNPYSCCMTVINCISNLIPWRVKHRNKPYKCQISFCFLNCIFLLEFHLAAGNSQNTKPLFCHLIILLQDYLPLLICKIYYLVI